MQESSKSKFAIPYKNLYLLIAGLLLMVIGYTLMYGGGTDDPNVFTGEQMFSFRRIVIAPLLILLGIGVEIYAIMFKKK